jgi:stage IV sporulation protein FB
MLFQPPARTPYDLNFEILGFPVQVHPLFWLVTIFLGASLGDFQSLVLWVAVVFFSILIHELGHSLVMRFYGQPSYISLYAGGGLSIPDAGGWGGWTYDSLGSRERINISLGGPLAGFLLAGLVVVLSWMTGGAIIWGRILWVIPFPNILLPWGGQLVFTLVSFIMWVNIFWGLINLLPVFPLDGGRIARAIFMEIDTLDGTYKSLQLSMFTAAVVAVAGLLFWNSIYIALLFSILAFQSYMTMQGGFGRL